MPSVVQLQYILSVERLRHFGKAAKECRVSQPSLSIQIQKVEEYVGFPIFDRNKKPVVPTQKGQHFIEQAKRVVVEHQKLLQQSAADFSTVSGTFRLGVIPTIMPYLIPEFLKDFSEQYPEVKLHIDELKTQSIVDNLGKDYIDAGILATPLQQKGIREWPLYYEPFYLYLNPVHPLLDQDTVAVEMLVHDEMWLLADGHCFKNQVINFCSIEKSTGVYPNVIFEGGNLETLRMLIKKGTGYTLVPAMFLRGAKQEDELALVRPFNEPLPSREISLVFRRDQWKKDILEALRKAILEHLPSSVYRSKQDNLQVLQID